MAKKIGKDCKVALGASTIVGMGTWSMSGISAEQIEATSFGDNWRSFETGVKDGGEVSFNGFLDPADVTGQEELMQYNIESTDVTSLRLYVDSTSYYEPCQTTGYFSPSTTTGNSTVLSHINVTSYEVGADKSGLLTVSFSAKVSGCMVLI